MDGSPPGSPIPGILQARTLEWVAISFSNAWKWKVKVTSLSRVRLLATPWTAAFQAPPSMGFSRQEYWSYLKYHLIKSLTYNLFSVFHSLEMHASVQWGHKGSDNFYSLYFTLYSVSHYIQLGNGENGRKEMNRLGSGNYRFNKVKK